MSQRVRKWPATTALVGAWLVIASIAEHVTYGFWPQVTLGIGVLVVLGSVWAGIGHAPPARGAVIAVTAATPLVLLITPPLGNVDRTAWLLPSIVAGAAAVLLGLLPLRSTRPAMVYLPLGVTALVFGGIILGGAPKIDVWVILQDVARGFPHNPYAMSFPNVPAGETSCCFNYLPSTFLATAPGEWLFGDVRWIEAGCIIASAALLARHIGPSRRGLALAVLVAGVPGTLLLVQQAWTEPLLLIALCAAAIAVDRGRWWVAALALGLALACKQHMLVLLPFLALYRDFGPRRTLGVAAVGTAVILPWFLMDPVRFKICVADFFLDETAPGRSLSIWRLFPSGLALPVLLLGTAIATWVAVRRGPRGGVGLLLGAGLILMTFDLLNKQTYLNQWWLASVLVVAGLALHVGIGSRGVGGPGRAAGQTAARPPSTGRTAPCTKLDRSVARYTMASAISSGEADRPAGPAAAN